jgi:hypothetical protein
VYVHPEELQRINQYVYEEDILQTFSFLVSAEHPLAQSSYSDLTYNPASWTITVKVDTMGNSDWWGCFVLPKDRMVRALTAYSGNTSYLPSKFYNYTENLVGNYNIVTVRIPPEIDSVNCTCTVFGDLTGGGHSIWDFVPDGSVDGSDLIVAAMCFGSYPGVPPPYRWNANCDITNDNTVDGSDLIIIARHFGQTSP